MTNGVYFFQDREGMEVRVRACSLADAESHLNPAHGPWVAVGGQDPKKAALGKLLVDNAKKKAVRQVVLGNALPSSLLVQAKEVRFVELTENQVNSWLDWADSAVSCVGHQDTANIVSQRLEREVPFNRISLPADFIDESERIDFVGRQATHGNVFITALYEGPRLPEGSKTLPEGATLKFYLVAPLTVHSGSWIVSPTIRREIY